MKVFLHHIYEYRKKLRNLILHTMPAECQPVVEAKLDREGIAYQIYPLSNGHMNLFFGATECVDVIKAIGKSRLDDYTPEEDFILGTMLGYGRLVQCKRYLKLVARQAGRKSGCCGGDGHVCRCKQKREERSRDNIHLVKAKADESRLAS